MLPFFIQYILTPIAVFAASYLLMRLMGKKAMKEMSGVDLIMVMVVGTAIAEPIVTKQLGMASWYGLSIVLLYIGYSYLALNNTLKKWFNPRANVLIQHGDIDEKELRKAKLTVDQLFTQLRVKGYTNPADVEMAIMESTGELSVIPKSNVRALQPQDLQVNVSPAFIPIPLVMDGEIQVNNLVFIRRTKSWLLGQLQASGISQGELSKVTLATLNQNGTVDVDTIDSAHNHAGLYDYKPDMKISESRADQ